jgi:hypothetical protein
VLNSFPADHTGANVARLSLAVAMALTYPTAIMVTRGSLYSMVRQAQLTALGPDATVAALARVLPIVPSHAAHVGVTLGIWGFSLIVALIVDVSAAARCYSIAFQLFGLCVGFACLFTTLACRRCVW